VARVWIDRESIKEKCKRFNLERVDLRVLLRERSDTCFNLEIV